MKVRKKKLGDKNIIGSNIERLRKLKGINQNEMLAKLQVSGIKITCSSLSRLEGQTRYAKDYEVLAVAEALNVDVKELLEQSLIVVCRAG